jgi:hypothetical protein
VCIELNIHRNRQFKFILNELKLKLVPFCFLFISNNALFCQYQSRLKAHVEYLCSPLLQGRLTSSLGQKLAAIYIQNNLDSVLVDTYEVKQIQHGGWLYDGFDTLKFKRDFFYSGVMSKLTGVWSLDTILVVNCLAEELFLLREQNQSVSRIYLISNWNDFLDLFGHEFSSQESVLIKDITQEPLQLFVKQDNLRSSKNLEYNLVLDEVTWFTENLICPVYYDPDNPTTWIISAHYDHLGSTNSTYYPGADDNASGVALLLELANLIKSSVQQFPMNITLAFFSAEEQGLLGSRYFVHHSPLFNSDIERCLNFDMVGFVKNNSCQMIYYRDTVFMHVPSLDNIQVESTIHEALLHEFSSDHQSFVDKGIPAIMFFSGLHEFYHSPQDTPERLDYHAMNALLRLVYHVLMGY